MRNYVRMNMRVKISKIGNSAGIVLPKDLLAHLDMTVGETLSVTKTPRGIELSPPQVDFDAQMAVAREVMRQRKRALQELAK
jgi:putative addiction module antidote